MDPDEIRKAIIIALVSSDELLDRLVLKGGNALALIHGIGDRASLDVDYSLATDFEDAVAAGTQIKACLEVEFAHRGLVVFDFDCRPKPGTPTPETPNWWGGYQVKFKVIAREKYARLGPEGSRREALEDSSGLGAKRTFKIDISKFEYTEPKVAAELDAFQLYVYSPAMIAAEKVRAICQQMPSYPYLRRNLKRGRARDFYDIHEIVAGMSVNLATKENTDLLREMFKVKRVPLSLLSQIPDESTFSFHASAWPGVEASATPAHDFRHYFEFLCDVVAQLEALWKIDSPS